MGKKGWWRQLQSGDYPETQLSYGQDMRALRGEASNQKPIGVFEPDTRLPSSPIYDPTKVGTKHVSPHNASSLEYKKKRKPFPSRNYQCKSYKKQVETVVSCLECGHRKIITIDFLRLYLPKIKSLSDRGIALFVRRSKDRLKCSKCGSKRIDIQSM